MSASGSPLASRIRGELGDLERVRDRVFRSWAALGGGAAADEAYLDSVAFNLHGIYSGIERLLELIAREVDGGIPTGETWHRDLLRQVSRDVPGVRPTVLGVEVAAALDELRKFRHLARNVYAINLVPDRLGRLVAVLGASWTELRQELLSFADFLDALAAGMG